MAKKIKLATSIEGLVTLRHKSADSENKIIGLSIASQDEQDIDLEVSVDESDDKLNVDQLYKAIITKGKGEGLNFKVVYLNEVDRGRYDERMVIKGDVNGHLNLNILPEQEQFFFEEKEYSIIFKEVEEEEIEEDVLVLAPKKKKVNKPLVLPPAEGAKAETTLKVLPEDETAKG